MPKVYGKTTVNAIDGYNSDIIDSIHYAYFTGVPQCRGIAQQFRGESRTATAFNIYRFIKNTVKYQKDPSDFQMIRLPGRVLHDKVGDCKSMSLLAACLLTNLDMPVIFRYASYNESKTPTHIYVVTYDKDGSEIIIDSVWRKFNSEAPYKSKRDVLMKGKYKK